jgi:hypothetical protein
MSRLLRSAAPLAAATVGLSAAVATAHGVYEVVRACGVPPAVAALYPVITDGLALVGYACAVRLPNGHRRWAWGVVVVAAGLSGIGQATLLGGEINRPPAWLRFGVGAWPAIAAALVAHLIFLMVTSSSAEGVQRPADTDEHRVQPPSNPLDAIGDAEGPVSCRATPPAVLVSDPMPAPAKERALQVAHQLRLHQAALPTVSELASAAGVARGTAATALRELRSQADARWAGPRNDKEECP